MHKIPGFDCWDCIKEGSFHTFETTADIFYLKEDMTCESSDLVYVVICPTYSEEYIEETGKEKQGLKTEFQFIDNTSVNRSISNYNDRKFHTCGKGEFKTFPFLKLHSNNRYLREQYEKCFQDKVKSTLH